jgi:hypothetical protein
MLLFSPIAGKLFDSCGPTLPLAIGSFMHVFGLMMTSLSTKYYQSMLSQSVCSGIGTSLIFSPSMTAVSAKSGYFKQTHTDELLCSPRRFSERSVASPVD